MSCRFSIATIVAVAGVAAAGSSLFAEDNIEDGLGLTALIGGASGELLTPTAFDSFIFINTASTSHTGLFGQATPYTESLDLLVDTATWMLVDEDVGCGGINNYREVRVNSDTSSAAIDPGSNFNYISLDADIDPDGVGCTIDSLTFAIVQHVRQTLNITDSFANGIDILGCVSPRGILSDALDGCGVGGVDSNTDTVRIVSASMVELRTGSFSSAPAYVGSYVRETYSADGGTVVESSAGIPNRITDSWHNFSAGNGRTIDMYNVHFSDAMLDLTGDGRFSEEDLDALNVLIAASSYDANFDFNGDSSLTAEWDAAVLDALLSAGAGSGLLADGDSDGDVDCDDLDTAVAHTFGPTVIAGTAGYVIEFDADLDGDNDASDRDAVGMALRAVEPSNFVFDGSLNFFDVSEFLTLYGLLDPQADMNSDGSFNFFDVSIFLTGMSSPNCLPPSTP